MRKVCMGVLLSALLCSGVMAQQKAVPGAKKAGKPAPRNPFGITPRAVTPSPPLLREFKARYVQRQLNMTPEQKEQYAGLVQSIMLAPPKPIDLAKVRELFAEAQRAKRTGDTKKADMLRKQLNQIGRDQTNEPDFFDNVTLILTPEQNKALKRILARLDRDPSGAVRPVDIFDFLNQQALSDEQRAKLRDIKEAFRKRSTSSARTDPERRSQLLGRLLADISDMLNEEQRAALKHYVDLLRPDTVPNIEVMDAAAKRAMGTRGRPPKTGG